MQNKRINSVKLGAFVLAGLLFLVLLLYMIGKNKNLFGSTFILKARFGHVQGLVPGNNVRYSGIETGTVKKVTILNDTLIEVVMVIDKKMKGIIRKDALVSIGTEGFVGNKVVNVAPSRFSSMAAAESGDVLTTRRTVDTDEMLQTLSGTNNDVAEIASGLKTSVRKLNESRALWTLLNNDNIGEDLAMAAATVRTVSQRTDRIVQHLDKLISGLEEGKGSAGMILTDPAIANNLNDAITSIRQLGLEADTVLAGLALALQEIKDDITRGKGPVHALLKDSAMVDKLNASLDNLQKGTDGFSENMEALKHNFLLRGYFRKQEKKQRKATRLPVVAQD